MFAEAGERHHEPHLHAIHQEHQPVCAVDSLERIAGSLPTSQERLVLAWAEIHRSELRRAGRLCRQAGRPPSKIDPLRLTMSHEIHRVTSFEKVADFVLRVDFEDGTHQVIDFRPVLAGELFGPLSDPRVFDQVRLDPEAQTLVWPNGADFDPAMLHDWPEMEPEMRRLASEWRAGTHGPPADELLSRLRLLLPELRAKYHVAELAVFGSRVRTDATPRSDLDLLVTFDPEASLFDLVGVELDLTERLGVEVDVVTPASIKPRIRNRILQSAVPV